MNLLTQYQDLMIAKRDLESQLLIIAKAQFALDRDAYFTVFPDEMGKQFMPADHFNAVISDFRITDEGTCEAWVQGCFGGADEAIYEFNINLDISLWAVYKNTRIEAYMAVKAEREAAVQAALARKRARVKALLVALS